MPPPEFAESLPPPEQGGFIEEFDEGKGAGATPVQTSTAPPAKVTAIPSGGGDGAPPAEEGGPAEQRPDVIGGAAQIRLYLARHNIYQAWYPAVGEIEVGPSGIAIVGTSLGADEVGASRKVCAAVIRSGLVAAAEVIYGGKHSHPCQ